MSLHYRQRVHKQTTADLTCCTFYSIFPGLGLGAILAKCATIPEDLIHVSANALAEATTEEEKAQYMLYPALERIREVSQTSKLFSLKILPVSLRCIKADLLKNSICSRFQSYSQVSSTWNRS